MMIRMLAPVATFAMCASVALAQPADSVVRHATRLFEAGNSAAAVEILRPMANTSAAAATLLGRIAWQSANYKDAARWLDAAIALDPRYVEAYVWRGRTYVQEIETTSFLRRSDATACKASPRMAIRADQRACGFRPATFATAPRFWSQRPVRRPTTFSPTASHSAPRVAGST